MSSINTPQQQPWNKVRTPLPTTVYAPPPPRRRIGVIALVIAVALLALLVVSSNPQMPYDSPTSMSRTSIRYNSTYPATPAQKLDDGSIQYQVAIVADLDKSSRSEKSGWISHLYRAVLTKSPNNLYRLTSLSAPVTLSTQLSEKGRGLELSELQFFNGKLYSVDDRTGIVFEIVNGKEAIPRFVLPDGPGDVSKGFKAEWMTVKDMQLVVGGMGKEWTTPEGVFVNHHPQYIKTITPLGTITHIDWTSRYEKMLDAASITPPGYMIHESGAWSNIHKRWFFMPRKASKEKYDDVKDERRASNLLLKATEDFSHVEAIHLGPLEPTHGFSSFKFVPGSKDEHIIAIKSEELDDETSTYAIVLDLQGNVLMPETKISDEKLEGIEFV